jgi:hypothetical protein
MNLQALLCALVFTQSIAPRADTKPNIVLIHADDPGWLRETKAPMPSGPNPSFDSKVKIDKPLREKR